MSEVNKPSGAELAAQQAAQQAAKQHKVDKQMSRLAGQVGSQQQSQAQGQTQEKKLKSAFDNVMESLTEQGSAAHASESSKFDSKLQEVRHEDDRSSGDRDSDEDTKTKDKSEKTGSSRETSVPSVKGRVEAKHSMKGQSHDSSGEQQKDGQSGRELQQKSQESNLMRSQLARMADQVTAPPPAAPLTPTGAVSEVQAPPAVRELPSALLNQIVSQISLIKAGDLRKEMQIEFRDNFFNGMKLIVTSEKVGSGHEISVEFLVPNRSVEASFNNEREKIADALGEKDIDIRSIKVTMM
jgi:hypothetical protein